LINNQLTARIQHYVELGFSHRGSNASGPPGTFSSAFVPGQKHGQIGPSAPGAENDQAFGERVHGQLLAAKLHQSGEPFLKWTGSMATRTRMVANSSSTNAGLGAILFT